MDKAILVVDDEAAVRDLIVIALEGIGHKVFSAWGGDQAIKVVNQEPSIVGAIIDVVMPGMGGIELADRLARTHPHIKKIFVTGFTDQNLEGRRYFQKPFEVAKLVHAIQEEIGFDPDAAQTNLAALESMHDANVSAFLSKIESIEQLVIAIPQIQRQLRNTAEALRILSEEQHIRLDILRDIGEGTKALANTSIVHMAEFQKTLDKQRSDYLTVIERRDTKLQDITTKQTDEVITRFQDVLLSVIGKQFLSWLAPFIFNAIILAVAWWLTHGGK